MERDDGISQYFISDSDEQNYSDRSEVMLSDFLITGSSGENDQDDDQDIMQQQKTGSADHFTPEVMLSDFLITGSAINNDQDTVDIHTLVVPAEISECAIYLNSEDGCMSDNVAAGVGRLVGSRSTTKKNIIEDAKKSLNCESEKCVLNALSVDLGPQIISAEIALRFKIPGPQDTSLLSNVNIDGILAQFASVFPLYAYNFNMLNYAQYSFRNGRVENTPDTLATIKMDDLYPKFKCMACVINSDVYQGGGKHWMTLFVDTRQDPVTVEFFNSSGNAPAPEWVNWMIKTHTQLSALVKSKVVLVKNRIKHQKSMSECGLYALFYIWSRLNGIPADYFNKQTVEDELMFEFRSHLFDDPNMKLSGTFDYEKYKKTVKIKWEE